MTQRWIGAAQGAADTYTGGPRQLARELGVSVETNGTVGYANVEDACVEAYWANRIVHGPRCGTALGAWDHKLNGGRKCDPCTRAEFVAICLRRGAAT